MNVQASTSREASTTEYCPYDLVAEPERFGLRPSRVDTRFGEMYTVATPQRTGADVTLFLHGVGGTWASWSPLLQQAAEEGRALGDVMLVDLPGFGASANHARHLDAQIVGRELLRVVRAAGWVNVRLVGHSMGGFLALDMASRFPGPIASVGCVSGAYFSIIDTVKAPLRSLSADHRGVATTYLSMSGLAHLGPAAAPLLRLLRHSRAMPFLLRGTVAHVERLKPGVLAGLMDNIRPRAFRLAAENGRHYDPARQWARISAPVRALFGELDQLVPPADGERLSRCLPGAVVRTVPDTGHFAPMERPAEVLDFVLPP